MSKISKMIPIPKGAIFTITTGVYSDYSVHGVFRAKEDIDVETLRDLWIVAHPDQQEDYYFNEIEFLASLSGILEPIDAFEWHLSNYSCVKEMNVYR
jgi:hypothetical protein